jgi:hypothetical protein
MLYAPFECFVKYYNYGHVLSSPFLGSMAIFSITVHENYFFPDQMTALSLLPHNLSALGPTFNATIQFACYGPLKMNRTSHTLWLKKARMEQTTTL